jgi:acetoin utilization deacetylase AcuC-like enzyme
MLELHEPLLEIEARPALEDDLLLAHSVGHVARIKGAVDDARRAGAVLTIHGDLRVSGASWEAATAAAGSVITATDAVLDGRVRNAFCAIRPPGNQAGVDSAGGFCLFNNAAIGARHLRERRGLDHVLIIEIGSQPGRGTAEIVAADTGLRFLTIHHAEPNASIWPRGAVSIPLQTGAGLDAVLRALASAFDNIDPRHPPDFIILSLGFDALASDPLGELALEPHDYHPLSRLIVDRANVLCEGRLVSVLEGGYDAAAMGTAVVQHLRALADLPPS